MPTEINTASPLVLNIAWDPAKAAANISKHGVTFAQAAQVLLDRWH